MSFFRSVIYAHSSIVRHWFQLNLTLLIRFGLSGVKIFFLSTIYALLGCPMSYVLWYRPLYGAMRLVLIMQQDNDMKLILLSAVFFPNCVF